MSVTFPSDGEWDDFSNAITSVLCDTMKQSDKYRDMVLTLLKDIQELQAENEKLKAEIASLERRLAFHKEPSSIAR